jgi:stalled ribosome rescue protein Dom34
MKIIKKYIDNKKRIFAVRMNLDANTDDAWNLYNLLSVGDLITGTCSRKIQKETLSLTKIEKKIIRCTLQIQHMSYDTEADTLRIHGVNTTENKWIGMGVQQSMNVCPPRQVSIFKKEYDSIHIQKLDQMIRE